MSGKYKAGSAHVVVISMVVAFILFGLGFVLINRLVANGDNEQISSSQKEPKTALETIYSRYTKDFQTDSTMQSMQGLVDAGLVEDGFYVSAKFDPLTCSQAKDRPNSHSISLLNQSGSVATLYVMISYSEGKPPTKLNATMKFGGDDKWRLSSVKCL